MKEYECGRPKIKLLLCLCSTLLTIVGNLVDKPEEAKFRRIRKASAAFQQSLGRLPGGCEALLAVGFTAYTEPNGEQVRTPLRSQLCCWTTSTAYWSWVSPDTRPGIIAVLHHYLHA